MYRSNRVGRRRKACMTRAEQRPDLRPVPPSGALTLGAVYKRSELHARYGGSRIAGIVPLKREPFIFLFHTEEPSQNFYKDGFSVDGLYWFSGEGTVGDMRWTAANSAVRDHMREGRSLLLFERVRRAGGLWRCSYVMQCGQVLEETRKDKRGDARRAIVFGLVTVARGVQEAQC